MNKVKGIIEIVVGISGVILAFIWLHGYLYYSSFIEELGISRQLVEKTYEEYIFRGSFYFLIFAIKLIVIVLPIYLLYILNKNIIITVFMPKLIKNKLLPYLFLVLLLILLYLVNPINNPEDDTMIIEKTIGFFAIFTLFMDLVIELINKPIKDYFIKLDKDISHAIRIIKVIEESALLYLGITIISVLFVQSLFVSINEGKQYAINTLINPQIIEFISKEQIIQLQTNVTTEMGNYRYKDVKLLLYNRDYYFILIENNQKELLILHSNQVEQPIFAISKN